MTHANLARAQSPPTGGGPMAVSGVSYRMKQGREHRAPARFASSDSCDSCLEVEPDAEPRASPVHLHGLPDRVARRRIIRVVRGLAAVAEHFADDARVARDRNAQT